jgi:hypothetical protein
MSEAMQRQTGQTPAWLLYSGFAIGVVGASVKKHAESVGELVAALATPTYSSDIAVAAALGQGGFALLVAGAVVALAGLVVIALAAQRKRRAAQWIRNAALSLATTWRRLLICHRSRASGSAAPRRHECARGAPRQVAAS